MGVVELTPSGEEDNRSIFEVARAYEEEKDDLGKMLPCMLNLGSKVENVWELYATY